MDQGDAVEGWEEARTRKLLRPLANVHFASSHIREEESFLSGFGQPRYSRVLAAGLAF